MKSYFEQIPPELEQASGRWVYSFSGVTALFCPGPQEWCSALMVLLRPGTSSLALLMVPGRLLDLSGGAIHLCRTVSDGLAASAQPQPRCPLNFAVSPLAAPFCMSLTASGQGLSWGVGIMESTRKHGVTDQLESSS